MLFKRFLISLIFMMPLKAVHEENDLAGDAAFFHAMCGAAQCLEENHEKELGWESIAAAMTLQSSPYSYTDISNYAKWRCALTTLSILGNFFDAKNEDDQEWEKIRKKLPYDGAKLGTYFLIACLLDAAASNECFECSIIEMRVPIGILFMTGICEIFQRRSYIKTFF